MNTGRKRSALSYIPGYANNAVLQLIIFTAVAYIMLAISWAIVMLIYQDASPFNNYFIPAIALPKLAFFKSHVWTLVTYGFFHFPNSFMEMASNMLWLYCFGSVVQMLVGHRQVIPLYIYSLLAGGIFYLLAQLLPGNWGQIPANIYVLGPRAGLMGMAAAAVALTPKYRFYLTETFSIPLIVVAGVFTFLMIIGSGFWMPMIVLLAGGALMGWGYVKLLQGGYRPGQWMYTITKTIENIVTPGQKASANRAASKRGQVLHSLYEPKHDITQQRIDDILDKINQKGYNALSAEEKDVLMRAGKEKN